MKVIEETAARIYSISELRCGLFQAGYQPKNPKTGKRWQASRHINGWDAYVLNNYNNGGVKVVVGVPPSFEEWSKEWTGLTMGFSTEALAVEAIAKEKARSGK